MASVWPDSNFYFAHKLHGFTLSNLLNSFCFWRLTFKETMSWPYAMSVVHKICFDYKRSKYKFSMTTPFWKFVGPWKFLKLIFEYKSYWFIGISIYIYIYYKHKYMNICNLLWTWWKRITKRKRKEHQTTEARSVLDIEKKWNQKKKYFYKK